MTDFSSRDFSDAERWVSAWEGLADLIQDGYELGVDEYANDLSCRDQLERLRDTAEVRSLWQRVLVANKAFQSILVLTKRVIRGNAPKAHFWYWGYPKDSPELIADLMSMSVL